MSKILVVEDDQFFREAVVDLLKKKYNVLQAPNGKAAKEIMTMQDFNLVLSDIQMPGLTGIELLEWSKVHKPVPFVIMTGFSMILETQTAFELGAKGFIAKPFKNPELLQIIDGILGVKAEDKNIPVAKPKGEYCKVSIDEFVARPRIDFDVFIKLSEEKIIKIAHAGEQIPTDKLQHYKDKGVKHLHVLTEDFRKLINFNMNLAKVVTERSDISKEKKMNFIKYTGEAMLEKVFVDGLDRQSLKEAQAFMNLSMEAITESEEHLDLLQVLSAHSDHIYAHSLGVSLYSVMIAKKMGYESNTVLFKLSMAGLYHDVGKKEIDREILDKPRHLVTKEERKIIESHVTRGQEILMAMPGVPEEVCQMVLEHHEDLSGLGFPFGKKKLEMHPLSPIIQAANIFLDMTIGSKGNLMTGPSAIAHMQKVYGDRIDSAVVSALKQLFDEKAALAIA